MHWKFRQQLVLELGAKEVELLELHASMWGATPRARLVLIDQIQEWREKNAQLRRRAR